MQRKFLVFPLVLGIVMNLEGPVFAVPTPFRDVDTAVDLAALKESLAFLESKGVRNVLSCGTTGEFASLSIEEREAVTSCCVEAFGGTVIANVSTCSVAESVRLAQHAKNVGCTGVILLPSFYFAGMGDAGVKSFLSAVLAQLPLPCYLYNFPKHTGNPISPEVYRELGEAHPEIVAGIKDSSGDMKVASAYQAAWSKGQVYVGKTSGAVEVLEAGLAGSVTGAGNFLPEALLKIDACFRDGKEDAAVCAKFYLEQILAWKRYQEERKIAAGEIACTKAGLQARIAAKASKDGMEGAVKYSTVCRAPISSPSATDVGAIKAWCEQQDFDFGGR